MEEKLNEIQCGVCLNWYEEKYIENKICRRCTKEIKQMPKGMSLESKIEYLKNAKLNKKPNKLSILSKKDKAAFLMCKGCAWLRKIDYINLKIYCSMPKCKKRGDKNV